MDLKIDDISLKFQEKRKKESGIMCFMHLITVIPISKGIGKETLTYFSSQSPEIGSLIEIPLRSKKALGLVTNVSFAENKKSEIKKLSYSLKKIEKIKSKSFLLPEFIEACSAISDYYATSTGAVISALVPKSILENISDKNSKDNAVEIKKNEKNSSAEVLVLQSDDDERYSSYKSLIREEFAKKKSVFVILPTIEEIKLAKSILEKGIEPYTFAIHNGLSKKEIIEIWNKILETPHTVLIIGTGYFLSVPRTDIGALILENEGSRAYSQPTRPFLDIRTAAEIISKKMDRKLIFGDKILRVETIFRQKEGEITEFSPMKFRILTEAHCIILDGRSPKNQAKKEFEIIGPGLVDLIEETKKTNDQLFLFCARKGLYPLTVCADCGETLSCKNCGSPVTLYGSNSGNGETISKSKSNYFLCSSCGEKSGADTLCKRCGSWKLTPLGIGIESAEKELKKKFPNLDIFIMDKDHVKTHKQAESIMKKFYEKPGSVLLGTELAIPYLKNKIGNTAVVTLDSLLSIPDFRINEKIMHIILSLRAISLKKVMVQTRRPDEKIFEYALKGNLADFYRDEIDERKRFGYPPFNTFIKISLQGNKLVAKEKMEKIKKDLAPYDMNIFEGFHTGPDKKYIVHGLIILLRGKWPFDSAHDKPDPILLSKLRNLSPQFSVRIDPDSLL